ncbi:GNAT family N-acetyltransferase [Ferruginibacter albus]|uniref:GNAT family N-acetyltransferase n=1 Tax=Ferruginibacter albus TaxID=2875540 RepID=UPI001CC6B9CB|nr:GNAT family N-acetyltransferase [Ferruginibacter albus]UAY51393.1 GNAT family N-acetyltransferase [Ferruginibacter albus]
MTNNIIIQKIEVTDAEVLSALAKQTFYDTFTGTCTEEDMQGFLEQYFNVVQITKELEEKDSFNFFAMIDNAPAGYIRFKQDDESFPQINKWKAIELKRLYIQKKFHGKGIAQQLMGLFLDHAVSNKYEAAWLGVWEFNFRAQKFYGKYGFIDSGYRHDFPIGNTPQTDLWFWKFF